MGGGYLLAAHLLKSEMFCRTRAALTRPNVLARVDFRPRAVRVAAGRGVRGSGRRLQHRHVLGVRRLLVW